MGETWKVESFACKEPHRIDMLPVISSLSFLDLGLQGGELQLSSVFELITEILVAYSGFLLHLN